MTKATRRSKASGGLVPGEGLAARGRRLWEAYCDQVDGQRGLVLLEEACRIADRLDRLDAVLTGGVDSWCRLLVNVRDDVVEVRIDSALTEARQQAAVLRQLVSSLPLKGADEPDDGAWLDGL